MADAFLLSAARTPIGKYLGALAEVPAPQLGAAALPRRCTAPGRRRNGWTRSSWATSSRPALGQNPARQAALKAGLPDSIAAYTVNKVCGSGLKAVMLAAQAIRAGDAELVLAGGMESMSRAPYLLFGARAGWKFGDQKAVDAMIHDGLWCACENWHMGEAAEHIAAKCGVARAEQDRFSAQSQQRAAAAWERGAFAAEIVPVTVGSGAEGEGREPRRGAAAGDDGGDAGEAEAGVPRGRHGDGRQRLDAERRRRGIAGRLGPRRRAAGGDAAGPRGRLCDQRRGAEGHLHRPGAGGAAGAGESGSGNWATWTCSS